MKENETREKIKMEIDRYHFIFGFDNMIAIFVPCNTMHITQNSEDYRLAYTFEHTCSSIEDALMDLRVFVSTGNGKLRLNNVVGIKINGSIYCFRYLGNRKENLSVMENYQEITRFTDKEKKSLIDSIHRENKVMDVLSGETIKIENVVISDNTFYAIDGENFKPVGNYEKGFTTKQSKEIEDNSQLKDDRKDPKLIANLVKDGNYGMPYLPEKLYADLRRLSMFRDQLTEDRIRHINRLHRELKIYFPEYMDAFGKIEGAFALEVLKTAPMPEDILALGEDGLREIWHEAKLRGRGYSRAKEIVEYAGSSVGLKDGTDAGREAVKWFARQIINLDEQLAEIESTLHRRCMEIPHAGNILEIRGVGENILSGILAEMGDISRFDDAKEIQKLSGMSLVASSSGKHKGQTKISHRGRKRLRYWLFQAAKSAVSHAGEYKQLHEYYTTRAENPLKKMQSLIVIACKMLRVIYTILKTGAKYDPEKLLKDIKRPCKTMMQTAA